MSKLDIENLLVERNGSFSESVSTTFAHDCSLKCQSSPISHLGIRLRAGDDSHFRLECTLNCKIGELLHALTYHNNESQACPQQDG